MAQPVDTPPVVLRDRATVVPATKFHIPAPRLGLVARDALVVPLTRDRLAKLTLLDAPPGFGKTTLLAEWHACPAERRPFAWLSLDEGDNDPVRFWSCVVEALRTVERGVGAPALGALQARRVSLLELVLPLLVNELAALEGELVLVLDDYHLIRDQQVHESVAFLLDHLPPGLHVAISTRIDPPLRLGRLRSRGEVNELRAAELRFSQGEARALLREALGRELHADEVAHLRRRTEGWAAGLYLAALSLRGREDARPFIESFAGDDRHIVDYLLAEVLAGLPEDLRRFLLRTSILERLCGPLCDAVTGGEGSARTLERIERSNLFLVPLDSTRDWYRYHHLFGELLRHELHLSEPGSLPALHRRASRWFREAGLVSEAIHHAAEAGDTDDARELIALHWNEHFNQGRLETVFAWLEALPPQAVRDDARLCVAGAWLAMDSGRLGEAAGWIAAAEEAIRAGRRHQAVEADAAVLRSVHGFKVGDLAGAEAAAMHAVEVSDAAFPRFVATCILGLSHYWRDELPAAEAHLADAARQAEASGNDLGRSYSLSYLALTAFDGGEPDRAAALADAAIGLSDDPGAVEHFTTMIGYLARGRVEERRGRLEAAELALGRAVELSNRGAGALEAAAARLALARARQALGERDEAKRLLAAARRELDGSPDPGTLGIRLALAERALDRGGGRPDPPAAEEELTDRELAVLRMLNTELSQREIGEALYVSLNTVKTHARSIYRKLEASTREEAVSRARELGLLEGATPARR